MKKATLIIITLLIIAAGFVIWKYPHQPAKDTPAPVKHCQDIDNPCYEISMPDSPTYRINSWKHYGDSNCVAFNSLPDNDYHGYCGIYKITKLHD